MDCLPPPEPLVLTNTPADNWKKFRQRIELYFKATETNKKRTPAQKAAIFLHVAGPEAIEVNCDRAVTDDESRRSEIGTMFTKRKNMIRHVRDVHKVTPEINTRVKCDVCGVGLSLLEKYVRHHIATHEFIADSGCGANQFCRDRCRSRLGLPVLQCVGGCRDDGHRGPRTGSHRHRTARATCGTPRGWRLKRRAPERGPSPGGPGSTGTPRTSDDDMDVWPFLPATQRKERPVTAKPSEGPKKPKPRVTAPKDDT
ncbi:hypothetical protein MRX96_004145 [Rhipicephalus microplus]